jgi:hypothetical protein
MLDYKIAVGIAMSSNGNGVLSELMKGLLGVHVSAKQLEEQLGRVRMAALGAFGVMAGVKAIEGIWKIVEASKELNLQLERTKQLGGDFAASLDATRRAAFATSYAVPTTTAADNVRLARELGTTIGHPGEALSILPDAAKAAAVVSHYTGENAEDIIKNLARVADARGQIYSAGADGQEHVDPARLTAELDAAAKALILGGGFLKSSDLLQAARQAGAAVKGQTPEAFYAAGVEAAIAMGASKLGTAETGLYQQFIGGTMTAKVAENLTSAGLLHLGEWHKGKGGGIVVNPSALKRLQPMMADPVEYLTSGDGAKAIADYAAKNGIDKMMAIFQMFGRQTVQRLVSEVTSNAPQFKRAREIYGNIPNVADQYSELQAHDLETNIKSLNAAWASFMQALGDAGVPAAITILHGLTDAIHFFTAAVEAHPKTAALLLDVAGALAVLGTVLSGLAVAGAIRGGLSLLGGGGGVAAGAAAGGGSVLAALRTGGPAAALAAALGWVAYQGSEAEKGGASAVTEANRASVRRAADAYGQTPSDGFDASGRPVQMTGTMMLDGRALGTFIAKQIGGTASTTAAPDLRASPWGGQSGAAP